MIRDLVHRFYAEVRIDPLLGPIFDRAIGGAWDEHLNKLWDFWSSVLLMTGRFKGTPMAVHVGILDIGAPHFQRWLDIFERVALEVCPPNAAALFVGKSRMIAQSLQLGIAVQRGGPPGSNFPNT
ncbi:MULTISPECIES: group III truncated hemoglobin [unclassified Brevundimonas]|uniref:group III truncated hemoglobin n=1 Tax=unclassified Brevundimonas TaxID=2622653 RepID=UPI0025BF25B8|nr:MULTISPECIES: group III truncated hemoglobin [unclassified Brevundimonas]